MVYYLKIIDVVVRINCADDLYLVDDWKRFFEEEWGKPFLIPKTKYDVTVSLVGLKTDGMFITKKTLEESIHLPKIVKNKLYFNNILNFSLFVYSLRKLLMSHLLSKGFLTLHASGFIKEGKAILVTGDSGTGKSTVLKQMINYYQPIGEDMVVIKKNNDDIWAYPTPFNIKIDSNLLAQKGFVVGGVITVQKDSDFGIEKLKMSEALVLMINQTRNILNTTEMAKMSFDYLKILAKNTYKISYKLGEPLIDLVKKI